MLLINYLYTGFFVKYGIYIYRNVNMDYTELHMVVLARTNTNLG